MIFFIFAHTSCYAVFLVCFNTVSNKLKIINFLHYLFNSCHWILIVVMLNFFWSAEFILTFGNQLKFFMLTVVVIILFTSVLFLFNFINYIKGAKVNYKFWVLLFINFVTAIFPLFILTSFALLGLCFSPNKLLILFSTLTFVKLFFQFQFQNKNNQNIFFKFLQIIWFLFLFFFFTGKLILCFNRKRFFFFIKVFGMVFELGGGGNMARRTVTECTGGGNSKTWCRFYSSNSSNFETQWFARSRTILLSDLKSGWHENRIAAPISEFSNVFRWPAIKNQELLNKHPAIGEFSFRNTLDGKIYVFVLSCTSQLKLSNSAVEILPKIQYYGGSKFLSPDTVEILQNSKFFLERGKIFFNTTDQIQYVANACYILPIKEYFEIVKQGQKNIDLLQISHSINFLQKNKNNIEILLESIFIDNLHQTNAEYVIVSEITLTIDTKQVSDEKMVEFEHKYYQKEKYKV